MKILTALQNPKKNEILKKKTKYSIIETDIQYQEGIIEVLEKNNKIELFARYKLTDDNFNSIIPKDDETLELMNMIARKRGAIISGGEIDYDKVIQVIMSDIKDGLIKNITFDRFKELV